jgi:hypothetical protein
VRRIGIIIGLLLATVSPQLAVSAMAQAGGLSGRIGQGGESRTADARVNVGSPSAPFPRNKQNEPAVAAAIDSHDPKVLVSGSNDEIDNAPCTGNHCSFTPGVTDNGIYFSVDSGKSWTQPTYTGWSARTGTAQPGPIGTVPWFYESGLVGDGDPALAFGPRPGPHGFSWSNGSRLYYSSLTSNFPGATTFDAAEAIAVSRTDDVRAAARGDKNAWMRPVIASKQLTTNTFSDKDAIWADNTATSPHFGNVYSCWTSFGDTSSPIVVARSTDGGTNWSDPVVIFDFVPTATTGPTSCTVRTDSKGVVYLLWEQINSPDLSHQMMARSFNGGATYESPRKVADVNEVGKDDPVHAANGDPRATFDGVGGARTFSGLQVDVANGAPSGQDATNQLVMTWSDARRGLNHEEALLQTSRNRGATWTAPVAIHADGDRPDFPAIAISPDGANVYLTYDAFLAPWRNTTSTSRAMQGVVRAAQVADGVIGTFRTLHRGEVGDARGSSENNLCCEFLGDYNYVAATRTFGAAVWNDVRNAAVCKAINDFRQSMMTPTPKPKPAPRQDCPKGFGNTDIYGGSYSPTD